MVSEKMKCKHENGWVIADSDSVLNIGEDEDIIVDVMCNNLGCDKERKLKIIVLDIEGIGD